MTKSVVLMLPAVGLLIALLGGCAGETATRARFLLKRDSIRQQGDACRVGAGYRSIEEVFARGEALRAEGETRAAEDYYRLALAKALLLEEECVEAPAEAVRRFPAPSAAAIGSRAPISSAGESRPGRQSVVPRDVGGETSASSGHPEEDIPEEAFSWSAAGPAVHGSVVDEETLYTAVQGDTLRSVGARFGINWRYLARTNGLDPGKPLYKGQRLRVVSRRILPKVMRDGLVINIPERTLYQFRRGVLVRAVPVTVGRPRTESRSWETPTGSFTITAKVADPSWVVPLSIRREMEGQGKEVVAEVSPGPANPLGKYVFRTTIPRILIHGTNVPASIYGFSSHGCIRVPPSAMEELYRQVRVNTPGEIVYQPVKIALTDERRVFLEVHRDIYRKVKNLEDRVRQLIRARQVDGRVDWEKVGQVVREKTGVAEDVSL